MKAPKLLGLTLTALLLGACAGESAESLSVASETWVLIEGKVDGQPLNVDDGEVTLSFVGGEAMVGNGSVNNYRAPVAISGGRIEHTGPLITTRMAGPIPAMKLESEYLSALSEAEALQRNGDSLTITGDGDTLTFTLKTP